MAERQIQVALNRALEDNNQYFQRERDKLEQWAEDQILAAEQALADTKARIRDTKRRARTSESMQEQKRLQEELKTLERQQIFDVEDEIEGRRDQLIEALERRMHQKSRTHNIFRIRWALV